LEKQCEIDRLKEEIKSLRQKLNLNQRKIKQGFFGSSTPSAKGNYSGSKCCYLLLSSQDGRHWQSIQDGLPENLYTFNANQG
jgi:hypothetical protein